MSSERVAMHPARPPYRQAQAYSPPEASTSSAAAYRWRPASNPWVTLPDDVSEPNARLRRPSHYNRGSESMLASPAESEASHNAHRYPPARPHFTLPVWTPYPEPQARVRSPVFDGVLGYHRQLDQTDPIPFTPMATMGSETALLPPPAQAAGPAKQRAKHWFLRTVNELNGKWRPDLLLALSALGRVCYGFGPIAIEQQIDLSPYTGSSNASSGEAVTTTVTSIAASTSAALTNATQTSNAQSSLATMMASAMSNITQMQGESARSYQPTNSTPNGFNNGTNPHGGRGVVPVSFSAWTIGLALLGIGLGATGALGLYLDGLHYKNKRVLATTFFTLHLIGIALVTSGHIINDELSRHLPVQWRIVAALPGALGSGLHFMTIPVSYSASKHFRKGPTNKSDAATNMLLLAPLRAFGGTLVPVWGFSLIYPVNPYLRDTLAIIANVSLIYAFALPMVDLRAWIGVTPQRPSVSEEERRRRNYLGRAALGLSELPSRRLPHLAARVASQASAQTPEVVPMQMFSQTELSRFALPPRQNIGRPELKRVNTY